MSTTPLEPIRTLERDIKRASATLGKREARYLVSRYYALQDFRIQSANQLRSILKANEGHDEGEQEHDDEEEFENFEIEPHQTLLFFFEQFKGLEKQVHASLDAYSAGDPWGEWMRQHKGVGPVTAAGLIAHIDISKAPHASSVHRFAGLLPGQKKERGVKRDYNADLKTLCWKMGDSFVKQKGKHDCYYGHLYIARKELEVARNNSGANAAEAAKTLKEKNIQDKATRATYESGKLPDGRVYMRARRYAVKRFLVHSWNQLYWFTYGTEPPHPWIQEYGGHTHIEDNPFVPYNKRKVYNL